MFAPSGFAQETTKYSFISKKQVVPLSMVGLGSLLLLTNVDNYVQSRIQFTNTSIDDYTQWVPIIILGFTDLLHLPARNQVQQQLAYFGMASLANATLVGGLKIITGRNRPNGATHAFPSGHTSQAFVSARVLWHEYKDSQPWLAHSGYLFATATGIMRITNNKHWLSDVVVGAGIGMLVTDLIYLWDPLKNWQGFQWKNTSWTPLIEQRKATVTAGFELRL